MTELHRATPKQWATAERWAGGDGFGVMHACLLELRARVESLEADQHRHSVDCRGLNDDQMRGISVLIAAATGSAEPPLAHCGSLIGRIEARAGGDARAAIREVATWLRTEYPRREGYGTAWANLIEEGANR
jgi:hypothetical protein